MIPLNKLPLYFLHGGIITAHGGGDRLIGNAGKFFKGFHVQMAFCNEFSFGLRKLQKPKMRFHQHMDTVADSFSGLLHGIQGIVFIFPSRIRCKGGQIPTEIITDLSSLFHQFGLLYTLSPIIFKQGVFCNSLEPAPDKAFFYIKAPHDMALGIQQGVLQQIFAQFFIPAHPV